MAEGGELGEGVRGGAEYCNAGYLSMEKDKEYMTLRRSRDIDTAIPAVPRGASVTNSWQRRRFERISMQAHRNFIRPLSTTTRAS